MVCSAYAAIGIGTLYRLPNSGRTHTDSTKIATEERARSKSRLDRRKVVLKNRSIETENRESFDIRAPL